MPHRTLRKLHKGVREAGDITDRSLSRAGKFIRGSFRGGLREGLGKELRANRKSQLRALRLKR